MFFSLKLEGFYSLNSSCRPILKHRLYSWSPLTTELIALQRSRSTVASWARIIRCYSPALYVLSHTKRQLSADLQVRPNTKGVTDT